VPCKEFKYVYKPARVRKRKAKEPGRVAWINVPEAVYARVVQIGKWEGRRTAVVVQAMFNLGMETYQTLLDTIAGTELPSGMSGVPGIETLIEAVGRAQIQRETLKRIQTQSAEMVEEQRRERSRIEEP
jgi:hypothetical protein